MAARACLRRASSIWRFRLPTLSWSSRPPSSGSPKMRHHLPRSVWSLGLDGDHDVPSTTFEGAGPRNSGGGGAVGRTYFGPTMHPHRPRRLTDNNVAVRLWIIGYSFTGVPLVSESDGFRITLSPDFRPDTTSREEP